MIPPVFDLRQPATEYVSGVARWRRTAAGWEFFYDGMGRQDEVWLPAMLPLAEDIPAHELPPPLPLPWGNGKAWCWHGYSQGYVTPETALALSAALRKPIDYPTSYPVGEDYEWALSHSGLQLLTPVEGTGDVRSVEYLEISELLNVAAALPSQLWPDPCRLPHTDGEGYVFDLVDGTLVCTSDDHITEVILPYDGLALAAALRSP